MPKSKTSLQELIHEVRRIEEHREILTEKKIKAIYQTLDKDLRAFIGEAYEKYADSDGRLYMANLDAKRKRAWFLKEIAKNCDSISPKLKKELLSLVDETYEKCYKGMSDAVKKSETRGELAAILEDVAVNPDMLKQAVNNNISKLTLPSVLEKHRNEIIYQAQNALVMGLVNGDRYDEMAKRIVERTGVSASKAMNIARTESHRNIESGMMDCAENLSNKLADSGYIYAATWHTMKDERVRPQQRRKTAKGWKTTYSKNGANHMKMEGQTVKVGEEFDLGNGVKAKAPGQSGVAAHDCNDRCYLEYNFMTVEEFAKATNQTEEQVRKKYNIKISKE